MLKKSDLSSCLKLLLLLRAKSRRLSGKEFQPSGLQQIEKACIKTNIFITYVNDSWINWCFWLLCRTMAVSRLTQKVVGCH